jgi:hypothetical protein
MENTRPSLRLPSLAEWREVALPKEHGSWSLALEPLALGRRRPAVRGWRWR